MLLRIFRDLFAPQLALGVENLVFFTISNVGSGSLGHWRVSREILHVSQALDFDL